MNSKVDSLITKKLGIYGWKKNEVVLLSVFADPMPVLLLGKRGTGKRYFISQLAKELKEKDIIYPITHFDQERLKTEEVSPSEILYLGYLNDLTKKEESALLSLLKEKKVNGEGLSNLKYCFASINTSSQLDSQKDFLSTSTIHPMLADCFGYFIPIPSWDDLTSKEQEQVLEEQFMKEGNTISLSSLIEEAREGIQAFDKEKEIDHYLLTLLPLLEKEIGYLSISRVKILKKTLISMLISARVLKKHGLDIDCSFTEVSCLHLLSTIPNVVFEDIKQAKLIKVAIDAVRLSQLNGDDEKTYAMINDPKEKVLFLTRNKDYLKDEFLDEAILDTLHSFDEKERRTVATILYIKMKDRRNLTASTMEALVEEVRPVLKLQVGKIDFDSHPLAQEYAKKTAYLISLIKNTKEKTLTNKYIQNILYSFLPDSCADERFLRFTIDLFDEVFYE